MKESSRPLHRPGRSFATALSAGSFATIATIPTDSEGALEFIDSNPGLRRFYRLSVP